MAVFEMKVKFSDGEELLISGVSDYGIKDGYWYAEKNEYRMFFNSSEVKYMGRSFDIKDQKR